MRKRTLWLVVVGLLLIGVVNVFAGVETIKDDNDGNKGYILINTGEQQGNNDVGHWTDIKDVPELKGEKGDKGEQGIQGLNGISGVDGINGQQGIQGDTGVAGQDGLNGSNGLDGLSGFNGENGLDGLNGIDGIKGEQGIQGIEGIAGKDIDPKEVNRLDNRITDVSGFNSYINNRQDRTLQNHEERISNVEHRVGKLEQTQYKIQTEFRVLDTKRLTISPYISNNLTRAKLDEVGVRVVIKLGSSYEEREIEKTNTRLDRVEQLLALPEVQEGITQAKMKKIKVIHTGNSFRIQKEF